MARSRAGKARSRTARLAKRARKLGEKKSESTNEDSGDDSLQGDLSKRSATNLPPQEVTQDQEVEEGTIESEKMAAVKESDENVVQGESDAELPVAEAGSNEERGERSVNETQWKSKQDKGNSSTAKKTARYQTQTEKNLSGNESECGSRTTDEQDANGKSVDENPSDTRKDGKKVSLQKKKAHSRAKTSDDVNENESDTLDDDQISDSPESTQADSNDKLADELMNHEETLEKKKTNSKTKTIYDVSDKKSDVLDDKEVSDSRKEVIDQAMSSGDVGDNEGDKIGDISKSTQGDKTVRISSHKRRKRRGQPQPVQTSDDEENSDDDGPPDVRNLKSLKATAVLRCNKVTKQGKSLARESKQRQSTSPLNMPPSENESEREEIEEDHTRNKWTSLEQRTKKRKSRQELRSEEEGDLSENLSESTGIVVKRKTTSRRYGKRMKSSESESRDSSEEEKEKISRGKTELINRNSRTRREEAAEDVRDDNECSGSSVSAENTENPQNELIELIISRLPGVQVDIPSTLAIPAAVISLRDLRDRLIKLHESELSLLVNQVEISVHLGKDFLDRMCDTSRSLKRGRRFEAVESSESDSGSSMSEILAYTKRRRLNKEKQRLRKKERKPKRTLPQRTATHKPEPESVSSNESGSDSESSSCSFSSASESTTHSMRRKKRSFVISSSDSWESNSDLEEVDGDFVLHEKHKLRRSSRNQRALNLRNHSATRRKIAKYCVDDDSGSSEDSGDALNSNHDDNVGDVSETSGLLDSTIEL